MRQQQQSLPGARAVDNSIHQELWRDPRLRKTPLPIQSLQSIQQQYHPIPSAQLQQQISNASANSMTNNTINEQQYRKHSLQQQKRILAQGTAHYQNHQQPPISMRPHHLKHVTSPTVTTNPSTGLIKRHQASGTPPLQCSPQLPPPPTCPPPSIVQPQGILSVTTV